ncbi:hypothetical protein ALP29_200335 [Pseudomonas syringae pv. avii]|uniref:Uncharacterized protein n=1 Tax=Pseudomonas syringae pv. avii TaxID=663959 RepID=A0A3M5VGZ9_PSESX|nr:hypothetical protein ALP29_200335 [Pseudomonas syringae pv. avii]
MLLIELVAACLLFGQLLFGEIVIGIIIEVRLSELAFPFGAYLLLIASGGQQISKVVQDTGWNVCQRHVQNPCDFELSLFDLQLKRCVFSVLSLALSLQPLLQPLAVRHLIGLSLLDDPVPVGRRWADTLVDQPGIDPAEQRHVLLRHRRADNRVRRVVLDGVRQAAFHTASAHTPHQVKLSPGIAGCPLAFHFHASGVFHQPLVHEPLPLGCHAQGNVMEALIERFVMPARHAVALVRHLVFDQPEDVGCRFHGIRLEPLHDGAVDGQVGFTIRPRYTGVRLAKQHSQEVFAMPNGAILPAFSSYTRTGVVLQAPAQRDPGPARFLVQRLFLIDNRCSLDISLLDGRKSGALGHFQFSVPLADGRSGIGNHPLQHIFKIFNAMATEAVERLRMQYLDDALPGNAFAFGYVTAL